MDNSSQLMLLGIDTGYTGCKAVAFNTEGKILASAYKEYFMKHSQHDTVELDPEEVWGCVSVAIREVTSKIRNPIEAVSISAMGQAFTPVDRYGEPLSNSFTAFDQRGAEDVKKLVDKLGKERISNITGHIPGSSLPFSKICWMKRKQYDKYKQVHKFLHYGEFILAKLGIQPMIDYSMAATSMMFDISSMKWSKEILESAEIDTKLLPSIAPAGTVLGTPDAKIAKELGLSKETRIVLGGHDQPCGALGAGVISEGQATYALGTVHCICPVLNKFMKSLCEAGFPCYPHVVPNRFVSLAYNFTGGAILKWFRDNFSNTEIMQAQLEGKNPYDLMLANLPSNPTSLFLMPHFSGTGTPWFDGQVRGSIIGLSLDTNKGELIKSIIEGTTYELAMNLRQLERSGLKVEELHAIGGSTKSGTDLQIRANVMSRKIMSMDVTEAASMGAAILAGVGTGVYKDFEEASRKLAHVRKTHQPVSEDAEKYKNKLDKYEAIYPLIREIYNKLNQN